MKAPRYDGRPMEVGPLARAARGLRLRPRGHPGDGQRGARPARGRARGPVLHPRPHRGARHRDGAARAPDERRGTTARRRGSRAATPQTFNGDKWEPATWPAKAQGYGYLDAPRGALGHWVQIENGKISRYQCVVPSTWNCSPRDAQGQPGPYEAALVDNHPLVEPEQPLEILRTIHSFDPCMACGVHVLDANGQPGHGGEGAMTARAAPPPARGGAHRSRTSAAPDAATITGCTSGAGRSAPCTGSRRSRIVVLAVTGLYIGRPYFMTGGDSQRALPDGLDAVHPLRRGGGAGDDRRSCASTGCSPATGSSAGPRCSRCRRATGSTW